MTTPDYLPPKFTDANGVEWACGKFEDAVYDVRLDLEAIDREKPRAARGSALITATIRYKTYYATNTIIEFTPEIVARDHTGTAPDMTITGDSGALQHVPVTEPASGSVYFGINELGTGDGTTIKNLVIRYRVELGLDTDAPVNFLRESDTAAYWYSLMSDHDPAVGLPDASDPKFLGRYLPSNLEWDAHPRELQLHYVSGPRAEIDMYCNGTTNGRPAAPATIAAGGSARISFDPSYTSSSVFFYLCDPEVIDTGFVSIKDPGNARIQAVIISSPQDADDESAFESVPVAYRKKVKRAARKATKKVGRPPSEPVILLAGRQGMEYHGAAEVSGGNVYHEWIHLVVGRHIAPVNGPSGWFDESVAYWLDHGGHRYRMPPDTPSAMGGGSPYTRTTHDEARTVGPMLIGWIEHRLASLSTPKSITGFIAHLRTLASARVKRMSTDDIERELTTYSGGESFTREFECYVRGTGMPPP